MTKTAWFDQEKIAHSMLNSGFAPLRFSDHFEPLQTCFNMVEGKKLLDLGCGVGEASETFTEFEYTGVDLPHIIDNAAKKKYPNANFLHFNSNEGDYSFIKDYDIVLMNSFISEIPDWYRVLNNVLLSMRKGSYAIIHRQSVTELPSYLENYLTYANLPTIQAVVNHKDFINTFYMNGFELLHECASYKTNKNKRTFLIKKG